MVFLNTMPYHINYIKHLKESKPLIPLTLLKFQHKGKVHVIEKLSYYPILYYFFILHFSSPNITFPN